MFFSVGSSAAGALVITGVGLDTNSPARSRAFLMTVTLPSSPVVPPPTVTISGAYPAGFTFSFLTVADGSVMYYLECTTNLPPLEAWETRLCWLTPPQRERIESPEFYQLLQQHAEVDVGQMSVDEVVVFSSVLGRTGPTYEALAHAGLGGQ